MSVSEARKQFQDEKRGLNRKISVVSIKSKGTSRDNMTPSQLLPLSQINQSKRQVNHLVNKTPSMIDLNPESTHMIQAESKD